MQMFEDVVVIGESWSGEKGGMYQYCDNNKNSSISGPSDITVALVCTTPTVSHNGNGREANVLTRTV
jgi:hypothetical protein